MRVWYRRVSSVEQKFDRQELGELDKVFEEKISGSTSERLALSEMIDFVRENDEVVVYSIDRLARNLKDLQYNEILNICHSIAFFTTKDQCVDYLIKNGKLITETFNNVYNQGCAFEIIERKNLSLIYDIISDVEFDKKMKSIDLYWCNTKRETYVFSIKSYNMVLIENFIYCLFDWSDPIPEYIKYYTSNNKIIVGYNNDDFFEDHIKNYENKDKEREKYRLFKIKYDY